jgi:hypothetical protein
VKSDRRNPRSRVRTSTKHSNKCATQLQCTNLLYQPLCTQKFYECLVQKRGITRDRFTENKCQFEGDLIFFFYLLVKCKRGVWPDRPATLRPQHRATVNERNDLNARTQMIKYDMSKQIELWNDAIAL